jgi:hypothetical protein
MSPEDDDKDLADAVEHPEQRAALHEPGPQEDDAPGEEDNPEAEAGENSDAPGPFGTG